MNLKSVNKGYYMNTLCACSIFMNLKVHWEIKYGLLNRARKIR